MDSTQIVDDIIQYVRLNLTFVRNKLKLPNGYRQITEKFKAECPHGELAELILPPIAQKAQGVIQESALIRELNIVVKSPMAKAIELKQSRQPEQPQEGYGSKQTYKTTSLDLGVPLGLSSFLSEDTNEFAGNAYTKYRRTFDRGKAIALTHRDLNATDLDLSKKPLVRQPQPVEPQPEPALFNPKPMYVPKGDHTPALFSEGELRYSSKTGAGAAPIRTQKGTVIKRDSKVGVGKRTRDGSVYLHRDYMDRLPDQEGLEVAIQHLPEDFEWNVVRSDTDGTYAFYNSPDFDTADEPEGGQYVAVSPEGKLRPGKTYQIWHHKWCWVLDDYDGFDVEASKQRSRDWLALPDIDFNRIGKREFWEANVVPLIKTSAFLKVSYVAHVPGHKNSKGEAAPWVIKSHETGKILSSHKTKAEAKAHLQQMHIHKGSGKTGMAVRPADAEAREKMEELDWTPNPNIPYPGSDQPWESTCKRCGAVSKTIAPARAAYKFKKTNGKYNGCWKCKSETQSQRQTFSDDMARKKMEDAGWTPSSDIPYPGNQAPWESTCKRCGAVSKTITLNVAEQTKGSGCLACQYKDNRERQTLSDADARKRMEEADWTPDPGTPYPGAKMPWKSTCKQCGAVSKTITPDRAWSTKKRSNGQNNGCAACSKYGFQFDKPGLLYFITNAKLGDDGLFKVGITGSHTRRLEDWVGKKGWELLCTFKAEMGEAVYRQEQNFFKWARTKELKPMRTETLVKFAEDQNVMTKSQTKQAYDGWTETISIATAKTKLGETAESSIMKELERLAGQAGTEKFEWTARPVRRRNSSTGGLFFEY
ncbi:MAG: hypothetical protein WCQ50_20740 [Spirochaetota bacterium]